MTTSLPLGLRHIVSQQLNIVGSNPLTMPAVSPEVPALKTFEKQINLASKIDLASFLHGNINASVTAASINPVLGRTNTFVRSDVKANSPLTRNS